MVSTEDWDQYDESVRDASQTVERAGTSQTEENEDADYDDDDNTKFNVSPPLVLCCKIFENVYWFLQCCFFTEI